MLSSFRVSLWGKGVEGASYNMEKPLEAAFPDGIQVVSLLSSQGVAAMLPVIVQGPVHPSYLSKAGRDKGQPCIVHKANPGNFL